LFIFNPETGEARRLDQAILGYFLSRGGRQIDPAEIDANRACFWGSIDGLSGGANSCRQDGDDRERSNMEATGYILIVHGNSPEKLLVSNTAPDCEIGVKCAADFRRR
jgi:hypothetical protein